MRIEHAHATDLRRSPISLVEPLYRGTAFAYVKCTSTDRTKGWSASRQMQDLSFGTEPFSGLPKDQKNLFQRIGLISKDWFDLGTEPFSGLPKDQRNSFRVSGLGFRVLG